MSPERISLQVPGGRRADLTLLSTAAEGLHLSRRSLRKAVRQGRVLGAMVRGKPYVEVGVEAYALAEAVHAWKERSASLPSPTRHRKRPDRSERKSIAKKILASMLAMGRSR